MNVSTRKTERQSVPIRVTDVAGVCDRSGALYLPAFDTLVVSDLHLEKGSSFARRGSMLPPYDTVATLSRLVEVIERYNPARVVSLGDSFHDPFGAERLPGPMRDLLCGLASGRDWYWVSGNHDPIPPKDLPGEAVDAIAIGGLMLRHEPTTGAAGEIAGHLHPGARLVRSGRSLRRACFAGDGLRLVMPAFGAYTGKLNVLDRAFSGLFRRDALRAYMLGAAGVYPVAGTSLVPG